MSCTECGDKPTKDNSFTKTVIEINNPEQLVQFRKVVVPASLGSPIETPPAVGKYKNVLLYYEDSGRTFLYSSDGVPTELSTEVPEEVMNRIRTLESEQVEEASIREAADEDLQNQIETIEASSDVKDLVGTYADLEQYDTSTLSNNDIIKVLKDETQEDCTTYYRWDTSTQSFILIGSEGPYYTQSQVDALISGVLGQPRILATTDYNFTDASENSGVALWLLPTGFYRAPSGVRVFTSATTSSDLSNRNYIISKTGENTSRAVFQLSSLGAIDIFTVSSAGVQNYSTRVLLASQLVTNLTTSSTGLPLDATMGKQLNEKIKSLREYSANFVEVGTWVDNYSLYKQTFYIASLPNAGTETIVLSDDANSRFNLIKAEGCYFSSAAGGGTSGYLIAAGTEVYLTKNGNGTDIKVKTSQDLSSYQGYLTVYFTNPVS